MEKDYFHKKSGTIDTLELVIALSLRVQMVSSWNSWTSKTLCFRQMDRFVSCLISYMQTSTIPQHKAIENVRNYREGLDKSSADLQTLPMNLAGSFIWSKTYHHNMGWQMRVLRDGWTYAYIGMTCLGAAGWQYIVDLVLLHDSGRL